VQNIRHYQGILEWQDIADNAPSPPVVVDDYLPPALSGIRLRAL
jgi:membrane-bound lytic murein transglycosylase F